MSFAEHIALDESYVLSIEVKPYTLIFAMDFLLHPAHPFYRAPSPHEWGCFRRGSLEVSGFTMCTWAASGHPSGFDATGEADFGSMDELLEDDGGWIFRGDWGEISTKGGHISVQLVDSNSEDVSN